MKSKRAEVIPVPGEMCIRSLGEKKSSVTFRGSLGK
jgi:hypothetical protein